MHHIIAAVEITARASSSFPGFLGSIGCHLRPHLVRQGLEFVEEAPGLARLVQDGPFDAVVDRQHRDRDRHREHGQPGGALGVLRGLRRRPG
jgi:hypothetical protein